LASMYLPMLIIVFSMASPRKVFHPPRRIKPGEVIILNKVVIRHSLSDLIREVRGEEEKKMDKPAEVIPFKPKK